MLSDIQFFHSYPIQFFEIDNLGNHWIKTKRYGIWMYDVKKDMLINQTERFNFTKADPLRSDLGFLTRTDDGNVWFGEGKLLYKIYDNEITKYDIRDYNYGDEIDFLSSSAGKYIYTIDDYLFFTGYYSPSSYDSLMFQNLEKPEDRKTIYFDDFGIPDSIYPFKLRKNNKDEILFQFMSNVKLWYILYCATSVLCTFT